MAFANETNAGRVQRMIETLQLLAPLLTELRPYVGAPEPAPFALRFLVCHDGGGRAASSSSGMRSVISNEPLVSIG